MSKRTIERSIARAMYTEFTRKWTRQKRFAGKYGEKGTRKPTFSQWYRLHEGNQEMMKQSDPSDVREHLMLDPWVDTFSSTGQESENGVLELPIVDNK